MSHSVVHLLSVPFAIIAGTGAGVFALLSWGVFRDSPFGMSIALLSVGMVAMTIYHTMLLVVEPESPVLHVLRSAVNTTIAIFVGLLILRHRQLQRDRWGGETSWTD